MRLSALFAFVVLALAGCAGLKADPEREAQADKALAQVMRGDQAGLLAQAHASIDPATAPAIFTEMQRQLPKTPPPPGKSISWTHTMGAQPVYRLERQYDFPEMVVVTQTVMVREGDRWLIAGFHFNGARPEQVAPYRFSLVGKSPLHYAVFAGVVAVPLFTLFTSGWALFRRRWGWAVLVLFGLGALKLNWATGAWGIQPIYFNLLGAGFMKAGSAFAPWIFTVGVPLPAILFWALGKHRPKPPKSKTKPEATGPGSEEPSSETPT